MCSGGDAATYELPQFGMNRGIANICVVTWLDRKSAALQILRLLI